MVKGKKLGLVSLIVATMGSVFGGARAGNIDLMYYTPTRGIGKELVTISDDLLDGVYIPSIIPQRLIAYVKDPNLPTYGKRSRKKINPLGTEIVKIDLDSEDVPLDIERFIRLKIFPTGCVSCPANMEDYATRNLTLYQEPNNVNADPNHYDLIDLTNWGTEYGFINLPNINSDPNSNHSQWIFRSDNYADIAGGEDGLPDGKVDYKDVAKLSSYWADTSCDPNNRWCDLSDLERDGDVDFVDFARMSLEWLYDTDNPSTW